MRCSLWLTLLLLGCTPGVRATGVWMRPAEVPLRSFPHIVVVAAGDAESRSLGRRLVRHLREPGTVVELQRASQLAARRQRLGPAAVVVHLSVTLSDRDGSE